MSAGRAGCTRAVPGSGRGGEASALGRFCEEARGEEGLRRTRGPARCARAVPGTRGAGRACREGRGARGRGPGVRGPFLGGGEGGGERGPGRLCAGGTRGPCLPGHEKLEKLANANCFGLSFRFSLPLVSLTDLPVLM